MASETAGLLGSKSQLFATYNVSPWKEVIHKHSADSRLAARVAKTVVEIIKTLGQRVYNVAVWPLNTAHALAQFSFGAKAKPVVAPTIPAKTEVVPAKSSSQNTAPVETAPVETVTVYADDAGKAAEEPLPPPALLIAATGELPEVQVVSSKKSWTAALKTAAIGTATLAGVFVLAIAINRLAPSYSNNAFNWLDQNTQTAAARLASFFRKAADATPVTPPGAPAASAADVAAAAQTQAGAAAAAADVAAAAQTQAGAPAASAGDVAAAAQTQAGAPAASAGDVAAAAQTSSTTNAVAGTPAILPSADAPVEVSA